jgi:hypothetical protein
LESYLSVDYYYLKIIVAMNGVSRVDPEEFSGAVDNGDSSGSLLIMFSGTNGKILIMFDVIKDTEGEFVEGTSERSAEFVEASKKVSAMKKNKGKGIVNNEVEPATR